MKKKTLTLAIALIIILSISAIPSFAASNLSANPTASTVYVNGTATAFEAYNIGGNNYFKLRDLAYALNGTVKQFEVGYDNATKAITLTTGQPYTPDGGEMARGDGTVKTATPTASRIYLDGNELNLTVYLIGGNNFFKLRDLMEAIDVFVGYDNATKAITLDTSKGYEPEGSATPTPTPTPTQPQSGSIDPALLGGWFCYVNIYNEPLRRYHLYFNEDGTFQYSQELRTVWSVANGNYSVSDGKIYYSNIYYTWADGSITDRDPPSLIAEYYIGDDYGMYRLGVSDGVEYLATGNFNYPDYTEIIPAYTYRRSLND